MTPHDSTGAEAGAAPIRVIIVDDSAVIRGLFARWIAQNPALEIVGVHRNGAEAVRQIAAEKPDVAILDIEMPEMDGLTALPLLLERSPETRVLVVSSTSTHGADITLKCLMRGATDYLAKPSSVGNPTAAEDFRAEMIARIIAVGRSSGATSRTSLAAAAASSPPPDPVAARWRPGRLPADRLRRDLVVIGASTGGPHAVVELIRHLGAGCTQAPIIVAQHMPATFTGLFAENLQRQTGREATEIAGGELLTPGRVYVCRGGGDIAVRRGAGGYWAEAPASPTRGRLHPSVDVLFESAAIAGGEGAVALLLTGVGEDGLTGARAIVRHGGLMMAQDEASSIVWSMPGRVVGAGLAETVADIAGLARALTRIFPTA